MLCSESLLLFGFAFDDEVPYLQLAPSPADSDNVEVRSLLFEAVRLNPVIFKPTGNSLVEGWMNLHQEPECMLEPADY